MMGERKELAGAKAWMTYDPVDKMRMVNDRFDSDNEFAMKRKTFEKLDRRNEEIPCLGVEVIATILAVEEIKLQ